MKNQMLTLQHKVCSTVENRAYAQLSMVPQETIVEVNTTTIIIQLSFAQLQFQTRSVTSGG